MTARASPIVVRASRSKFTATASRFADSRIRELFLINHERGNASDTNARDAVIVLQHGADLDTIRRRFARQPRPRLRPLGAALDIVAGFNGRGQ